MPHTLPAIATKTNPIGTTRPTPFGFASVRGGSCVLDSIDDILSQENLSTLFASMAIADGLILAFAPDVVFRLLGGSMEKDSLGGLVAEVIGSVNIGTAITVAMLNNNASMAKAVGLGLLPRVCVGITSWLTGKLSRVGFQFSKTLIAGKITFAVAILASLFLEKGRPEATLKVVAGMETLVGLFLAIFPEKLGKTVDIDLGMEGK
jgi:uncharacterized membrane protein